VVALELSSGRQIWWTGGDGDVQTLALAGRKLYVGGHFEDSLNGVPRAGLAVLDARSGAVLSELSQRVFGPAGGSGVWKVLLDGRYFRFAGQFTTVGSSLVNSRYAGYQVEPDPLDTQPPGQPTSLRAYSALSDAVTLTWGAAADDFATVAYRVRRDGVEIGESTTLAFEDTAVQPGTTYNYSVAAMDFSGNEGVPSVPRSVTTEPDRPVLLARDRSWSIFSQGVAPAAGWQDPDFTEANWSSGVGEFGFGDGDETTYISPLGVAHYFRTDFQVLDPAAVQDATLRLRLDDGALVFVNGVEVARINMPTGPVGNSTTAATARSGAAEIAYYSYPLAPSALVEGRNQIAIEVHNSSSSSSDVSMDAFITFS
jgi:chitodextrinase